MKTSSIPTVAGSRTFRALALLALGAAGLAATGAARAGNVAWSVGFSAPGVQVGLANVPQVYVQPAPVYVQPGVGYYGQTYPVYGAATPDYPDVYYGSSAPVYYGGVAPVVYAPPVVYRARPIVRPLPPMYRPVGPGYRPPYVRPVARHYGHGNGYGRGAYYRATPVYGGGGGRPGPYR